MVPTHGEYAVDVMPLTQVVIDSAAATAQPWRIPLPGGPAPLAGVLIGLRAATLRLPADT
ncbi:hypothetical protein ABZW44_48180 [Streptomyces mirabilis]|uniref:hypothetical protein n=1 Tax=Streptomyces mirabilis TaxID=68239 RepID=UPI0033B8F15B